MEVEEFRKSVTGHFRGLCRIYLKLVKKNQQMSTCDRLDLGTRGSRPIMLKISSDTGTLYCTYLTSLITSEFFGWELDLGEPTHTLVPCWMLKPLPPRNRCTGWFAPTMGAAGCVIEIGYPS